MRPPELKPVDFAERRKAFLQRIENGVAILPSAPHRLRNNDTHFPFRQDSSFYYLTGFDEPESFALFAPGQKAPFQLFCQPKDKTKEMWEGFLWGPDAAKKQFGADAAFPSRPEQVFDDAVVEALCHAETVYYRVGEDAALDERVFRLFARARRKLGRTGRPAWPIFDPDDVIGEMRSVKSKAEQQRMEYAAQVSAEAHSHVMRVTRPGMNEGDIEAVLLHDFRSAGSVRVAYNAIVASGPNACVLHYGLNNREIRKDELVLVDAGCEYDYYASDITRTFPASGRFTEAQREIYEAVLDVQKACIAATRPGKSIKELHELAVDGLIEHLLRLKILKGTAKAIRQKQTYKEYFPHGLGHLLGMDVHDVGKYYTGDYDTPRKLEPGMAFTVEPGLYFAPGSDAPPKYRGIGVRIEDDVVVTANGCKVITSGVPKEVEEVESLCRKD